MRSAVFVYGTLMSPEVLRILLGRVPKHTGPALVRGFKRHPVIGHVFPGMIPSSLEKDGGGQTEGLILFGISRDELQILDWFEGDEYSRQSVVATVPCSSNTTNNTAHEEMQHTVQAYICKLALEELDLEQDWDYQQFRRTKLKWFLTNAVRPCRLEMDELGIGKK